MKEELSSRLEQIDLLGCGGLFQKRGDQVHGRTESPVDLFVVDRKGGCRREDRGMGTVIRTKEERRRVAEELLAGDYWSVETRAKL